MSEMGVDDDMRREMNTLVAAYVLDALPESERSAFERYLEQAPDTAHEVAELFATSALLGSMDAAPAPPELRDRVLAAASQTRPLPPLTRSPEGSDPIPDPGTDEMLLRRVSNPAGFRPASGQPGPHEPGVHQRESDHQSDVAAPSRPGPHRGGQAATGTTTAVVADDLAARRRRRTAGIVGAALGAAAVVALGILVGVQTVRLDQANQQISAVSQRAAAIAAVAGQPDVRARTTAVAGGGQATVLVSGAANRGVVLLNGVGTLPDRKTYELWLIDSGGKARPVTTFDARDNRATVTFGGVRPGDSLGLSVEPEGGSTTGAPTTPPVFALQLA